MTVKQRQLMHGTWVLTLASLLVKILSAIYRVPFQNLVGDEGFYVYQQVYPIYGIGMSFSLVGLPVFLSKLVAEKHTLREKERVVKEVFPLLLWFSLGLFLLVFSGQQILAKWMGDVALAPLIGVVSFPFLLMPWLTSYRGFFQGLELMEPTAYSQLLEQIFRVGVILIAGSLFHVFDWSIYEMGSWAMSGAFLGGVVALGVLIYYRRRYVPNLASSLKLGVSLKANPYLKRLLIEGGLICGYSSLLVLFQLVDSFVVKNMLVAGGMEQLLAKTTKGAYDRGQPLLQVGMVLGVALTTAFLPSLRRYFIEGTKELYDQRVTVFIHLALTLASGASLGLVCLLPSLNRALFSDNNQAHALQWLMVSVGLMSMILVFQIIYQSQNQWWQPLLGLLVGLVAKIGLSPWLTKRWGTIGTSASTLLSLLLCLVLLVVLSGLLGKFSKKDLVFAWKLALSLGMMVISLLMYQKIQMVLGLSPALRLSHLISAIVGVLVGGGVLLISLLKLKVLTTREWLFIPLGKRLLRLTMMR